MGFFMVFEAIGCAHGGGPRISRQVHFLTVLLCFSVSLPGGGLREVFRNCLKHLTFFNCCFSIVVLQLSCCNRRVTSVVLQLSFCISRFALSYRICTKRAGYAPAGLDMH
jgi:hypothetical protein